MADMIPVPIPSGSSRSWRATKQAASIGKCNSTAGNSLVDYLVFLSPIDTHLLAYWRKLLHPSPQTVEVSKVRDLCSMVGRKDRKEDSSTQRARGNLKGLSELHHLRRRTAARRILRSWPVKRQPNWTVALVPGAQRRAEILRN